jgi:hypothetical protein
LQKTNDIRAAYRYGVCKTTINIIASSISAVGIYIHTKERKQLKIRMEIKEIKAAGHTYRYGVCLYI